MMNKFELGLNEVMEYDVDESIETELKAFKERIEDVKLEEVQEFKNWVKVYKAMNYDMFPDLVIENIYKFNNKSAIVEINFKGLKEYDLLHLNDTDLTVTIMNVKEGMVKTNRVRRLLVPQTPEEALKYATSHLYYHDIDDIALTIKEVQENGSKYNVTKQMNEFFNSKPNKPSKTLTKDEKKKAMEKSPNREPLNKPKQKVQQKPIKKQKAGLAMSILKAFKIID